MTYLFAGFVYWPVWLVCIVFGHPWYGMLLGSIAALSCFGLVWFLESRKDKK